MFKNLTVMNSTVGGSKVLAPLICICQNNELVALTLIESDK